MGYSVATTVLSPAASFGLTDLATARDELSIKANDTTKDIWLGRAIRQVSAAIASHTKRAFAPEVVQDTFDVDQDAYPYQTPGGFAQLQLSRWPVLAVLSVVQTLSLGTTEGLIEGRDFRVDPASGQLLRLSRWTGVGTSWDAIPVTVQYVAGFGALVEEADAVPTASPYQITPAPPAPFSCDVSVSYADGAALERVVGSPTQGQYRVAAGSYSFNAADAGAAVAISYATFVVPDDLIDVALRLVTARYTSRGRDPSVVQQETPGVGMQRFWFGGAPGQKGPFPPDIEGALESYCMPVVA